MTTIIKLRRGTAAEWADANPILDDGEAAFERDTNKLKIGDGVKAYNDLDYLVAGADPGSGGGGTGGGGTQTRTTVTKSTASMADLAYETGVIEMAIGYRLAKIETNVAARVRLYASSMQRDADVDRDVEEDPVDDHGLIFEFISNDSLLSAALSPMVDGYSLETVPTQNIPYTITNLSGATSPVTVTLTWQRTE